MPIKTASVGLHWAADMCWQCSSVYTDKWEGGSSVSSQPTKSCCACSPWGFQTLQRKVSLSLHGNWSTEFWVMAYSACMLGLPIYCEDGSGTSLCNITAQYQIPVDSALHGRCCKNLTPNIFVPYLTLYLKTRTNIWNIIWVLPEVSTVLNVVWWSASRWLQEAL